MEYKLVSCVSDSPIERIRGSEFIRVSVCSTYQVLGKEYKSSGFALCKSDDEAALLEAYTKAGQNAEKNFLEMVDLNKLKIGANKAMAGVVKDLLKPHLDSARVVAVDKINNSKVPDKNKYIQQLEGPSDEHRQARIDSLCEALGIQTIITNGDEPWTLLEALALIEELSLKTVKFESKEQK